MALAYEEFLRTTKVPRAESTGLPCDPSEVHHTRKPHQKDVTAWGVRGGRRAFFLAPGLGKTGIQYETIRLILQKLENPAAKGLIIMPLNVRREFLKDAPGLGIEVAFCQTTAEILRSSAPIILTNFESVREGKIDTSLFAAVSLDEAAILRSNGSKTFGEFLFGPLMAIPYRFVATATPSLKHPLKLIYYAHFLGIMEMGQAKTRFFQRNSEKADDLTLIPHMEDSFWLWVASWACMLQLPSDLGYDDTGYVLPKLTFRWHEVPSDHTTARSTKRGQGVLIKDTTASVPEAAGERRSSIPARIAKLLEIRAQDPEAHRVIWHNLEDERKAIQAAIPDVAAIYGELGLEEREAIITDFAEGRVAELATKPQINGAGCNIQPHCHRAVFFGIDFKATDFVQAVFRLWRFLQPSDEVIVDLIYTEAEINVREELERQWNQHLEITARLSALIRQFGLDGNPEPVIARKLVTDSRRQESDLFIWNCGDSIPFAASLPSNSVGHLLSSWPFGNQYEYGEFLNDLGHTDNLKHFFEQMDYMTPEALRILKPGRVYAIHVKDRIMPGAMTGEHFQTVEPFHCGVIDHMRKHGFHYGGMITVVTDVVRENNQTYRLSYGEMLKDASKMTVGLPEYVLLFRKAPTSTANGYADERIHKGEYPYCDLETRSEVEDYSLARWQLDAHAFWKSDGRTALGVEDFSCLDLKGFYRAWRAFSYAMPHTFAMHCEIAEELARRGEAGGRKLIRKDFMTMAPQSSHQDVWTDIARFQTLNTVQTAVQRVKHICPLQRDLVKRLIRRFSNRGEVVCDLFGGLATVPVEAVNLGRIGWGGELNPAYWQDGLWHLRQAEIRAKVVPLFTEEDYQEDEGIPEEVA